MRIPFTKYEIRAARQSRPDAWDDFWYSNANYESSSGVDVNQDLALTYSTVWACVRVISEDIASLPLFIYERTGDAKRRAPDHPLYRILHDYPNPEMTAMQFRETMQAHILLWGNCYAEIQRNMRGDVIALWPLNPSQMYIERNDANELVYRYKLGDGTEKIWPKEDIFHVAGLANNGLEGYSPVKYHKEAMGIGLSAQNFQGATYKNGARLSYALVHPAPKAPSEEGRKKFRQEINKEYSGTGNAGKIGIFWEGMHPEPMSMSLEDAQFIESRKFTRTEICAIYRVPPHKVMDLERATFSNIEQQSISYVVDAIRPWAVRWEQAIGMRLLGGSQDYFAEHLMDGLLRGDLKSRYDAYAVGRNWGWLSVNDIRALENMNPVEDGDDYIVPMNMTPIGQEPESPETSDTAGQPSEEDTGGNEDA